MRRIVAFFQSDEINLSATLVSLEQRLRGCIGYFLYGLCMP